MRLHELADRFEPVDVCGERYWLRCPVTRTEIDLLAQEQDAARKAESKAEAATRTVAAAVAVCIREDENRDSSEPVITVEQGIVILRKASAHDRAHDFTTPVAQRSMALCGLTESAVKLGKALESAQAEADKKVAEAEAAGSGDAGAREGSRAAAP